MTPRRVGVRNGPRQLTFLLPTMIPAINPFSRLACAIALCATPHAAAAQLPDTAWARSAGWFTPGEADLVLDSAALANTGARTLSEALAARVPGLSVTRTSGMSGAASRIVLRGSEAYLGLAEPLIVIDGVQVNGGQPLLQSVMEGTAASLLDDLPLEAIERVELQRSPAEMALNGSGGNRGILRITTRRPSSEQLSGYVAARVNAAIDRTDIPPNYRRLFEGAPEFTCPLFAEAEGSCTGGALLQWSPVRASTPFQQSMERSYRAGVAGLLPVRSVGISGSASHDEGEGIFDRNANRRSSAIVKAVTTPARGFEVEVGARLLSSRHGFPMTEGFNGILGRGMRGSAHDDPVTRGYFEISPDQFASLDGEQRMAQTGGHLSASWRVHERSVVGISVGYDRVTQVTERRELSYQFGEPHANTTYLDADHRMTAVQANATLQHPAPRTVAAMTVVGLQYVESELSDRQDLLLGPQVHFVRMVNNRLTSTGLVLGERLVWNGNRVLNVGVRHESMSIHGISLDDQLLPWIRFEWIITDETFFRRSALLQIVRLRAESARLVDHHQLRYDPAAIAHHTVVAGDRPEALKQSAIEFAVFLEGVQRRAAMELRVIRRNARDGAYLQPGVTPEFLFASFHRNNASWTATGFEADLTIRPITRSAIGWESRAVLGRYRTRTDDFTAPHHIYGYSAAFPFSHPHTIQGGGDLVGYMRTPLIYADPDGDGLLREEDVINDHELAGVAGSPLPRRELGWMNTFRVGRRLVAATHLEHRGGHLRVDQTEYQRCRTGKCAGLHDPRSGLAEQARAIAARRGEWSAYLQDATFTRLREVSARWHLPFAPSGDRGATFLTVSARNVALWTDFRGADPEVGTMRGRIFDQGVMFNAALPREFSLRLDFSY